ncbi:MAG: FtsX-like permease family protein [Deltaproteobacteria bacterium]|nr:FtsX-like permease family protein [Deltaproteobacteria bacterium]
MMKAYSLAFFRANKIKTLALCLSLAFYFALVFIAATLHRSIPEIAQLPLKQIGVQTIVQKSGEIPSRMVGAIFPHSNGPLSTEQFSRLAGLPFVEEADLGLYFWYFDEAFFKAGLGVDQKYKIFTTILAKNIDQGGLQLGQNRIVITAAFSTKHGLAIGDSVALGDRTYAVSGILRPNISGNIIPADFYMDLNDALEVARDSVEMRHLYRLDDGKFGNVVLLKGNPGWQGDKEKLIKEIDEKLLVFSEKTFTREISAQLGLISSAGRLLFLVLGSILAVAFGLLTIYNLKSREQEIAILRMLGWRILDLKKQFIGENFILLCVSILFGSALTLAGLFLLGRQTVSMELPWDISARPHFLPEENSIERVVSAPLPVHVDSFIFLAAAIGFLLLFLAVSLFCFRRIKKIKPNEFTA